MLNPVILTVSGIDPQAGAAAYNHTAPSGVD